MRMISILKITLTNLLKNKYFKFESTITILEVPKDK